MFKRPWKRNTISFCLALTSSLLLLASGTTGVSSWIKIEEVVLRYANFQWINWVFILLIIVASLGGIAVLIGGILILKNKVVFGKIFITLGSGAGLIGFFANLFISIVTIDFSFYSYLSFSSLGILFAVGAQIYSKKRKKKINTQS